MPPCATRQGADRGWLAREGRSPAKLLSGADPLARAAAIAPIDRQRRFQRLDVRARLRTRGLRSCLQPSLSVRAKGFC
jgi:hypothetical protein